MSGWIEYIAAFAAFLGAHIIPALPRLRAGIVARIGRAGYIAGFSAVSLGLLLWLIVAAGRAPYVEIWAPMPWQRWLVNLAMPAAIIWAACLPGMAGLMRGFAVWAGAHLVANGDLAHVIFFGVLVAYAMAGVWRSRGTAPRITARRVAAAALVWAVLFALHPYVAGVSPAP